MTSLISVPAGFIHFVFNGDGNRIYAVNASGTVSVISLISKTVVATIAVGASTRGIAYSKKYKKNLRVAGANQRSASCWVESAHILRRHEKSHHCRFE